MITKLQACHGSGKPQSDNNCASRTSGDAKPKIA